MPVYGAATAVLDVSAGTLESRTDAPAGASDRWWGAKATAALVVGHLTITSAEGASHTQKASVLGLAFTPDDRYAVFVERSRLTIWDAHAHAVAAEVKLRAAAGMALTPRGDEVVVWSLGSLRRLSIPDGAVRGEWKADKGEGIFALAVSPDGARLAVATLAAVLLIDCATMRVIGRMEGHAAMVNALQFDRDGARLVSAGYDSTALVWSVADAVAAPAPQVRPPSARKRRKGA